MIAIAAFLPLLFLVIWLFTVKMPGPAFAGPLPPLTHTPQDTPDKLDYDRMARVVHGLTHVVRALAN
jgi:hypothetical protein